MGEDLFGPRGIELMDLAVTNLQLRLLVGLLFMLGVPRIQ